MGIGNRGTHLQTHDFSHSGKSFIQIFANRTKCVVGGPGVWEWDYQDALKILEEADIYYLERTHSRTLDQTALIQKEAQEPD